MNRWLLLIGAIFAAALPAGAAEPAPTWSADVAAVHDGDTLTAWLRSGPRRGQLVRVRLSCADAPELRQERGPQARALLQELAAGRRVRVAPVGRSYDRIVARVILADGRDLGLLLVSAGLAWCDLRYCQVRRDAAYRQALDGASQAGLGIWGDPGPVAPWTWRRGR
jgi:endonuclease YncB( thermonuclease family)